MYFFGNTYFYYIVIGLQAICAIHCLRRNNQNKWIWVIVFLPLVGCIAYIFTEMINRNDIQNVQSGVGTIFNPTGKIKRLEEQLRFADTFNNRISLADAYQQAGQTQKAIDLYESSLTGAFTENEHVLTQLIYCYYNLHQYEKVIPFAKKIYGSLKFNRSPAHVRYAISLDYAGNPAAAEKEFLSMKARYANFEARYQYGLFLLRENRKADAQQVFNDVLGEVPHLGARERRANANWFELIRGELKKMKEQQAAGA